LRNVVAQGLHAAKADAERPPINEGKTRRFRRLRELRKLIDESQRGGSPPLRGINQAKPPLPPPLYASGAKTAKGHKGG